MFGGLTKSYLHRMDRENEEDEGIGVEKNSLGLQEGEESFMILCYRFTTRP